MTANLPCLPLIEERHINAVRSHGEEYKWPDLSMRMFMQTWSSTALGFGGVGGQAITNAYTIVVEDYHEGWYSVFFGNRMAYLIRNPNQLFFEDMQKESMKPVSQASAYRRETTE